MGGRKRKLVLLRTGAKTPEQDGNFRARYKELEEQRKALLGRLELHQRLLAQNPAARRAATLLNSTFRRSDLAQRAAILQAAAWLIEIIERSATLL